MVDPDRLARVPLLAGLTPADLAALATQTHERHYRRGAIIFRQGDPGTVACIVGDGRVKVYQLARSGQEQLMGIFRTGEPFGLVTALDRAPFPATAEATEESLIWSIPAAHLQRLMADRPSLAAKVMQEVGRRLRRAQERVHTLATHTVQQRIVLYLLEQVRLQSSPNGGPMVSLHLTMTHQELGSYLGASRETITRALADLRRDGAVQTGENDRLLVDPTRLEQWLYA